MENLATGLRRMLVLIMSVVAFGWFAALEYRGLFQPDEGRYAEIPREMLASGDWITPRLNDLKYFEKPPLQYWATAVSFALFGEDEWTARLWPAITGFLGVLFMVFAGNRLGPPGAGSIAGLVLASSAAYFLSSQFLTLDMGLTFFMSATLLCFLLAHAPGAPRRFWLLCAWAAMACAVLTKGLVGIVLPGAVLAAYVLLERDWRLLREMEWTRGGLLFCAIVLPWFVAVQARNPEFLDFFIVHEHFARYLQAEHNRPGAWWYFLAILVAGMMPWTAALPGVVARALRLPAAGEPLNVDRVLLLWVAVMLLFFSFSKSKLPAYIVPALPALALLIGRDAARRSRLEMKWPSLLAAVAGAACLAFLVPGLVRMFNPGDFLVDYLPWIVAAAALLVAAGLAAWWLCERRAALAFVALSLGSLGAAQLALSGLHNLDDHYSTERFAEQFLGEGRSFAEGVPFYSVAYFDESLPFYLGRTMTLVAHRGELAPGIAAEPGKYVESVEEFARRWRDSGEAYATMRPQLYEKLRGEGLPMRLLALDREHVIVARQDGEPPLRTRYEGLVLALAGRRSAPARSDR